MAILHKAAKELASVSWSDVNFATWINACAVHRTGVATTFQVAPDGDWAHCPTTTVIGKLLMEHLELIILRDEQTDRRVMHSFIELKWDRCTCGCDPKHPNELPKHESGDWFQVCTFCRHGKSSGFLDITEHASNYVDVR